MTTRDQYVAKIKKEIDDLNGQIDALEDKARQAQGDAEKKYKEQLVKLRAQSKEAREKLEEVKKASEGTWDKLVAETDRVLNAFKHSYNYFKSQL